MLPFMDDPAKWGRTAYYVTGTEETRPCRISRPPAAPVVC